MEVKELFQGVASTKTVDGAIAAAAHLREELEQHVQRERARCQKADDAIEALIECLILHQDVKETNRPLSEREPFRTRIEEVFRTFEEIDS